VRLLPLQKPSKTKIEREVAGGLRHRNAPFSRQNSAPCALRVVSEALALAFGLLSAVNQKQGWESNTMKEQEKKLPPSEKEFSLHCHENCQCVLVVAFLPSPHAIAGFGSKKTA
jgi:hypothetical protein